VFRFVRIGKGVTKTAKTRTCIQPPHTPMRAFAKRDETGRDLAPDKIEPRAQCSGWTGPMPHRDKRQVPGTFQPGCLQANRRIQAEMRALSRAEIEKISQSGPIGAIDLSMFEDAAVATIILQRSRMLWDVPKGGAVICNWDLQLGCPKYRAANGVRPNAITPVKPRKTDVLATPSIDLAISLLS
jgi:hypothetical protein